MNRKYQMYAMFLFGILVSCSACIQPARLPLVVPPQSSEDIHFEDSNHLRVAVQTYTKKTIIEHYFGIDLLEASILPVQVVVENQGDQAILLQTSNFHILPAFNGNESYIEGSNEITTPMENGRMASNQSAMTAIGAGIITIGPVVALPLVILTPFMDYHNRRMVEVSANIKRQALTDRIVYPGENHHGFIYLKFNGDYTTIPDCILTADFQTLKSKRVLTFKFPVQINKDDLLQRKTKERTNEHAE